MKIFCILELIFGINLFGLHRFVGSSSAGYFVNLLQVPSLCPLTSFCSPWNPLDPSKKSLVLIDHAKINLSIHGLQILTSKGRLKNNAACWSYGRLYNSNQTEDALCRLVADSGNVICSKESAQKFWLDNGDLSLRYMVPKSCVEWKANNADHATQVFFNRIEVKIPIKGRTDLSWTRVIISLDEVLVDGNNFTWQHVMNHSITVGLTTIKAIQQPKTLMVKIQSILSLDVSTAKHFSMKYLIMKMSSLKKFWSFPPLPNEMATSNELRGLLGDSGFLEALYFANESSRLDSSSTRDYYGCNPVAWYAFKYPVCRCQLARIEHIPLQYPQDMRLQACCEWWLGRALQGPDKGALPNGFKREVYFNQRLACAEGIKPLNDLDKSCEDNFCCSKTNLEVARWNFKVRGKCKVLRSLRPKSEEVSALDSSENQRTRISLGAAYGIMGITFVFLITFRYVNSKLEECRSKALAGFDEHKY